MFVTRLDMSWLDSPFLSHSRAIKDPADIRALREAGVKSLTIDLSRGVDVEPLAAVAPVPPPTQTPGPARPIEPPQDLPPPAASVSIERELRVAFQLRSKIKKAVENVTRALETGTQVDVGELVPLVDSTLDSLERNDQALMSLVHLSRKTQRLTDHVFGTFCLVLNLALQRKISDTEREQLGLAALLHEAGWTQLPINLIGKRSRYTAVERRLVHKHTLIGNQILESSDLPELTRRVVAEHHELLDGSGYPAGLRGDQIHPLSQLLTVVDVYEERVHQLTDEPGMIPTNALRSLYRDAERGVFSADAAAALISLLGIYPPTTAVLLNSGERAVIKEHYVDAPLQPRVVIYYGADGTPLDSPLDVDLRQATELPRMIECALDLTAPGNEQWRRLLIAEEDLGG
jgi:HD-GYP domain-containing protein (c-di-GMP phosphodiesterase class II)